MRQNVGTCRSCRHRCCRARRRCRHRQFKVLVTIPTPSFARLYEYFFAFGFTPWLPERALFCMLNVHPPPHSHLFDSMSKGFDCTIDVIVVVVGVVV